MSTCTEKHCQKPAQNAGLCIPHWYRQKERQRLAWRADPALCYQCGQKCGGEHRACASCRAKENRRRKKQRAAESAQRRQSPTQAIGAANRTLKNLSSPAARLAPPSAPLQPHPDLLDLLSLLASSASPSIDPPQPDQAPPPNSGPRAWDRRPGESAPAHRAFLAYLHMGTQRSLQKAYRLFKQSDTVKLPGRWRTWCVEHQWVARAAEYDRHQLPLLQQSALQGQRASHEKRLREIEQAQAKRSAAVSNAARRAWPLTWSRRNAEGRICQGQTRAGAHCKRLAVPAERYCPAHTRQAFQELAHGVIFYPNANVPFNVHENTLQPGPQDVPMPPRTPPDMPALLWFPRPKKDLPARLLYADDCPAPLRSAIRLYAQQCARLLGLRLQIEPPRRPPVNQ